MVAVDVDEFNWEREVLRSDVLTLVDFWHERCPWCIMLDPVIGELAEEYGGKVKFVKLNVFQSLGNRKLAMSYGVMGTPTLVFFCAGRPVGQVVGFMPKEDLKQVIDEMLKRHKDCIEKSTPLET
ncbi:MAG: thioredoxin fold domain-containing protein [Candidatus Freyarchaeota archaeon]|nr:thioredoxin fold domain-containing protein [Candidatus Jordarchaeia archaeon]